MLIAESDGIEMTVADNGRGFAAEAPRKRGSFGLFGMTERAAQLGGTALVESAPDAGTSVKVRLPRRSAARADE
jgi:signal transduction histidine kinase